MYLRDICKMKAFIFNAFPDPITRFEDTGLIWHKCDYLRLSERDIGDCLRYVGEG
jgi:hypothetical protein